LVPSSSGTAAFTILLVRHAAPEPPVQGSPDALDDERALTSEGRRASERLAEQLSDYPISAIYSSPYRRARETVEPMAAALGVDVRIVEDLRERRLAISPLTDDEFLDAVTKAREDPDYALPGGESTNNVLARAFRAFEKIHLESPTATAVACTHGGLISIVRWSLGGDYLQVLELGAAAPLDDDPRAWLYLSEQVVPRARDHLG
jgi:2,3-bisphosphoglycerate-dependent phosphoglycerate mutase